MLKRRVFTTFVHGIIWLLFSTVPLLIFSGPPFNRTYSQVLSNSSYWIFIAAFIFLFYFTTYYIIPRFYLQKNYSGYGIAMFLIFVGFFFLKPFELMIY